jgi:hypothetical protein
VTLEGDYRLGREHGFKVQNETFCDELALNHAARHDEDVKAELEKLRKQVAKMEERLR